MRYFSSLLAAILLVGCASRPASTGTVYNVSIQSLHNIVGLHDGDSRMLYYDYSVASGADKSYTRHVVAHELGHVLGVGHQGHGIMQSWHHEGEPAVVKLSAGEITDAKHAVGRRITIKTAGLPRPVYDALIWAANLWNSAIGESVLIIG